MIRTSITHEISPAYTPTDKIKVERTVKTIKLLGIIIYRKVYHYPQLKHYDVVAI